MEIKFKVGDKFNCKEEEHWYTDSYTLGNPIRSVDKNYWPTELIGFKPNGSCILMHPNGIKSNGHQDDINRCLIRYIEPEPEPEKIFISKSRFELITDL